MQILLQPARRLTGLSQGLTLHLHAALAEQERKVISERTIAALAAAKARGQALGDPKLAEARAIANANHTASADTFADSVAPAIREAQAAGAKTLRQIAAALNGRGIGTARGGKWGATTVANVIRAGGIGEGSTAGGGGSRNHRREPGSPSPNLMILETGRSDFPCSASGGGMVSIRGWSEFRQVPYRELGASYRRHFHSRSRGSRTRWVPIS